jgi:hypothetical protein
LHKLLIIFSSLILGLYIFFLGAQQYLFTSSDFDSELPWASFEKSVSLIRCTYKIVLTCGFIFDKAGENRAFVCMICAGFNIYIAYRRLMGALIFNRSVHFASIFYEILAMWLFLSISTHTIAGKELTITDIFMIFACSLVNTIIFLIYQERKRLRLLTTEEPLLDFDKEEAFPDYFFRIY